MRILLSDGRTITKMFCAANCTGYAAKEITFDYEDMKALNSMCLNYGNEYFRSTMTQLAGRIYRVENHPKSRMYRKGQEPHKVYAMDFADMEKRFLAYVATKQAESQKWHKEQADAMLGPEKTGGWDSARYRKDEATTTHGSYTGRMRDYLAQGRAAYAALDRERAFKEEL